MSNDIRHVTILGGVQGVGYRAWVVRHAIASRLEGWVRNRRDGSVEALFSGEAETVADMVALCRRGPPSARVRAVSDQPADAESMKLRRPGESFSVLGTV
jgi:acylphosphatase